jgi:hypothetical protein
VVFRDGWLVEIASNGYVDDSHYEFSVTLSRAAPSALPAWTAIGMLVGAAAGWLIGLWVARRGETVGTGWLVTAASLLGIGVAAALPATALSGLALLGSLFPPMDPYAATPAWLGYTFMILRPLAYIGAATTLGGLTVLTVARRA